jgi:hypothetical protein
MRRGIFVIILIATHVLSFAQVNSSKYTASTLMFLDEQLGTTQLPTITERQPMDFRGPFGLQLNDPTLKRQYRKRHIAQAEMVDGVKMISCFIGLTDNNFAALESLGVSIQAKFDKLCTALMPVEKIEAIAALANVTRIEVAEVLEPCNDQQRAMTRAYDAISNSDAAKQLGLTSAYTGKGVILGVIDTGVDFTHIAFKDKNGNSRIKRAYKLSNNSTSLTTYSTATQIAGLTYDTNAEDHGTHTSTTAGGSSVIVDGNSVTVTDDHASATYGGMAPEADLVIAALSSLYTTSIATAIQNICNYADQEDEPCVISLSLGSQNGPHDGTGSIAQVVNQYAGENHIIVYAASNDAMRADYFVQAGTSTGGGCYASATSTNSKTMLVNLQKAWTNADGNVQLYNPTFYACARTANTAISLKFRVVDVTTGNVVYSSSAYSGNNTINMTGSSGLAQYFYTTTSYYNNYGDAGAIRIVRGQDNYSGKYYFQVYCPLLVSRSYNDDDGDGVYNSQYELCVSVYPTSGSTIIDMWDSSQTAWFGNDLQLSSTYANSYTIAQGNDDCSVSDNACFANVISVGAYVSKNQITDYSGETYDWSSEYPNIGDHASFSSWQATGYGPLGTPLPTINAPGARIVAGVNHYHTASVDDYSYYGEDYISDLVVNSTSNPYAAMEGTSMATPCVSGIVAQWLQACKEKGITATPDYIKEVMENTWITDKWTQGTASNGHGAKTFGTHGKIDAIAGLQYILGVTGGPVITATPEELEFEGIVGETYTKTVSVKGASLEDNITTSISGSSDYTIAPATIRQTDGAAEGTITVSYKPTTKGETTATLTLASTNAESVTVLINGTAVEPELLADPESLTFASIEANQTATLTFDVVAANLREGVTLTVGEGGDVFSIDKQSLGKEEAEAGTTVTVTFSPSAQGVYTGFITLESLGAESVSVALNAEATKAYPDEFAVTIGAYGV